VVRVYLDMVGLSWAGWLDSCSFRHFGRSEVPRSLSNEKYVLLIRSFDSVHVVVLCCAVLCCDAVVCC
jgi:hypothetical protein